MSVILGIAKNELPFDILRKKGYGRLHRGILLVRRVEFLDWTDFFIFDTLRAPRLPLFLQTNKRAYERHNTGELCQQPLGKTLYCDCLIPQGQMTLYDPPSKHQHLIITLQPPTGTSGTVLVASK